MCFSPGLTWQSCLQGCPGRLQSPVSPPTWAKANLIRQEGLRITLLQSISLPPGEKGQHLSLLSSTSSPHLPLRPSALHLSRGSLQSQDNLETSAGRLPETLKKFPPFPPFVSLSSPLLCTPTPQGLLLITGTLLSFFFLSSPHFFHSLPPFFWGPFCLLSLLRL